MSLKIYNKKRDFRRSPEPHTGIAAKKAILTFVVHRHEATRLHYDLRLEMEGVLKSWAIPKGPSMVTNDKRLAIMVEDHPLEYGKFYGEIPKGNYGAGTVEIWDKGTYTPMIEKGDPEKNLLEMLKKGDLKVVLKGKYLNGAFALVRMNTGKEEWLLIKKQDEYAQQTFNIEDIQPVKAKKKSKTTESGSENTEKTEEPLQVKRPRAEQQDDIKERVISISGKEVKCTNLTKIYWPGQGYTKGDLINYYRSVARYILPYLKNRPQSLNRFPNGITGTSFYQKDIDVEQVPKWVKTVPIYSKANEAPIDYLICNDEATLIFMANLGCIEINPWHSTWQKPDHPAYMMLDLDPGDISFVDVINTALVVKEICDEINIPCYCKTSGATGLHVYIPTGARYNYDQVKMLAEIMATITHNRLPSTTSIIRSVAMRKDKVYVDFLQNRPAQTVASAYSVRPKPFATVSAPLKWEEVNHQLTPGMFTIENFTKRLEKVGDLWQPVLGKGISMSAALKAIEKLG